MANDFQQGQDDNSLMNAIGQAGAMMATAGAQFLSRALDAGGRRAADAMVHALNLARGEAPKDAWLAAMLSHYRDYLGEMATLLPRVAQRLSQAAQDIPGQRLLLRVRPVGTQYGHESDDDQAALAVAKLAQALETLLPVSEDIATDTAVHLYTTPATLKRIKDEVEAEGVTGALADLLDKAWTVLRDKRRRDLPGLLDELKYDFRRGGPDGLLKVGDRLKWLADPRMATYYKLFDALRRALGEEGLRELLRHGSPLASYGTVAKKPGASSGGHDAMAWAKLLAECLTALGFETSASLSVLRRPKAWVVFDHAHDRIFEVRQRIVQAGPGQEARANAPRPSTKAPKQKLRHLELYGECEGRRYTVKSTRLLLPLRVQDASQGVAVWLIDKRLIQDQLDNYRSSIPMRAWDVGANRTPVALFMVHYREGDLGEYLEMGLGCFATPHRDPLGVGMFILGELPVSTQISADVGRSVWGYPKQDLRDSMKIRYSTRAAELSIGYPSTQYSVWFTLPRGGDGSSAALPLLSYTRRGDQWYRSVLTRSGSGEAVRGGNAVDLEVRGKDAKDLAAAWSNPLLGQLLGLGLVDPKGRLVAEPNFTSWTERLTGELGPPCAVTVPDEEQDV